MRDVELESRIRDMAGVSTCTVGPDSVVVVAARGTDAAQLERRIATTAELEGRALQVLGGVRMAAGRAPVRPGILPELGRVALAAGAAAAVVGLVVGPSSARLFDSVLSPVTPLGAVQGLSPDGATASAGRPVRAVSHRRATPAPVERLTAVEGVRTLAVEPVVRPRPGGRGTVPQTRSRAAVTFRPVPAVEVVPEIAALPPVVEQVETVRRSSSGGKGKRSVVQQVAPTTTSVMFSIASTSVTADSDKKRGKAAHKGPDKETKADKAHTTEPDRDDRPRGNGRRQ